MAVGARAAVRGQAIQFPVEERVEAAGDGIAGLTAALIDAGRRQHR
jgi:hypothetical protein